jgi:hypothetical protein
LLDGDYVDHDAVFNVIQIALMPILMKIITLIRSA